jgi:hypothetical protein
MPPADERLLRDGLSEGKRVFGVRPHCIDARWFEIFVSAGVLGRTADPEET